MQKVKAWIKENSLVVLYFIFAVLIEMVAVFVVEGSPILTRPLLSLGLLIIISGGVLLIKNNLTRLIVCALLLIFQGVLDLVFSVIYNMTDQYFDWGMLNLRNDAFAILENIPLDFVTFYAGMFFSIMYIVYGMRVSYWKKTVSAHKKSPFFYAGLMVAGAATLGCSFVSYYPRTSKNKYDEMIEGRAASAYSAYGMIGNLLGEVGNVIFEDRTPIPGAEIDDFIYKAGTESKDTAYFGVAKDKNVLTILCESLEWFTFLRGDSEFSKELQGEYPNALDIPQDVLCELYPNLTDYYNNSVVMTNFHSREKTDISETISIMGSYPTGKYVNYEFAGNTLPQTLPNVLKALDEDIQVLSFHNGFKTFYNRDEAHPMLGFEELIDMYDMEDMSDEMEDLGYEETFHEYMDDGTRNLDSQMVDTAADLMFPTDKRFYSFITTITMHGMYYDRENLQAEHNPHIAKGLEILQQYFPDEDEEEYYENAEALYYYMTTGLEFDRMLGRIVEELENRRDEAGKPLLDNTTIVLFADHNAYYQEMSNYVKEIKNYKTENKFTDLYNVPFMIRDKDLVAAVSKEDKVIEKFTCTADIVPTLLDLLGIRYYTNLYYGHSVFSDTESVLYSRAYDYFIGDGILRRSVKDDMYLYKGLTETGKSVAETLADFEKEGVELVQRIKYCDYIFKQDHFGTKKNYDNFQQKLKALNP